MREALEKIWKERDKYHHFNPGVERDRERLEHLAREKVRLLVEVQREVFGFSLTPEGKLAPKQPKYWGLPKKKAE